MTRHPRSTRPDALLPLTTFFRPWRRGFGECGRQNMLPPELPEVNHKKIYRLYREASLAVCRRRKVRRPPNERLPLAAASAPNAVWSMDFVSDALANGRRLKC